MAGIKKIYTYKISSTDKPLMIAIRRSKRADDKHGVYWSKKDKWSDMQWELTMRLEPEAMIVQLPQDKSIYMFLIVEFESDGGNPPKPTNNAIGLDVVIVPLPITFDAAKELLGEDGVDLEFIETVGDPVQENCICPDGEAVCVVEPGSSPDCEIDCVARPVVK